MADKVEAILRSALVDSDQAERLVKQLSVLCANVRFSIVRSDIQLTAARDGSQAASSSSSSRERSARAHSTAIARCPNRG